MNMLRGSCLFVVLALAGCGKMPQAGTTTGAQLDGYHQYLALRAAGYNYKVEGQVRGLTVTRLPDGNSRLSIVPGSAGVTVSLVRSPKRIVALTLDHTESAARTPSSTPVDGCPDETCGGATPNPRPTPPPNYSSCAGIGGAAYYDNDAQFGGCLSAGQSRTWSCGTWTWSSRGRGRYSSWDGFANIDNVPWLSVSDGGSRCQLGS